MKAPTKSPFTDEEIANIGARAVADEAAWATCEHPGVAEHDHSCPACRGTLRRCCVSLVGAYDHEGDCPEVARRSRSAA